MPTKNPYGWNDDEVRAYRKSRYSTGARLAGNVISGTRNLGTEQGVQNAAKSARGVAQLSNVTMHAIGNKHSPVRSLMSFLDKQLGTNMSKSSRGMIQQAGKVRNSSMVTSQMLDAVGSPEVQHLLSSIFRSTR